MARKITDNTALTNFEDDWGGVYNSGANAGKEWGKSHAVIESAIKAKVSDIEGDISAILGSIGELASQIGSVANDMDAITNFLVVTDTTSTSLTSQVCSIGDGFWYRNGSSGPQRHVAVPVAPGQKVTLTVSSISGSFYTFLTSAYNPPYSNGNTMPLATSTNRSSALSTEPFTIVVPENSAWLALNTVGGDGSACTWDIVIKDSFENYLDHIENELTELSGNIQTLEEKMLIEINEGGHETLSSSLTSQMCSLGTSWYMATSGDHKNEQRHVAFAVTPGQTIILTPSQVSGSYYAFLTSSYNPPYANGNSIPFISGTSRNIFTTTDPMSITIPDGCSWLALTTVDGAGNACSWSIVAPNLIGRIEKRTSEISNEIEALREALSDATTIQGESKSSSSLTTRACSLGTSWYKTSGGSQSHVAFKVIPGQIVELTASATLGSYYGFLTSSYNPPYSNGNAIPYVSGTSRYSAASTNPFRLTIPENCAYIALTTVDGAGNAVSWTYKIIESIKTKIDAIDQLGTKIDDRTIIETPLDTSLIELTDWFINTDQKKWGQGQGRWQCKLIEIEEYAGNDIIITKNPNGACRYAFLRSDAKTNNTTPAYCKDVMTELSASDSPKTETIPIDAKFLYVYANADGTDVTPSLTLKLQIASLLIEKEYKKVADVDLTGLTVQDCSIGATTWYSEGTQSHIAFPVTAGEIYRIKSSYAQVALMTSSYSPPYSNNNAIPFASGETRRIIQNTQDGVIIIIPTGCAYMGFSVVYGGGTSSYTVEKLVVVSGNLKDLSANIPVKLRIAHWNVGHFALGTSYTSTITHEDYPVARQKWVEALNGINADILMLCEYSANIVNAEDEQEAINARLDIFGKIYNKYYIGSLPNATSYMRTAIFTNIALKNTKEVVYTHTVQGGRYYYCGEIMLGNTLVKLVETHLDWNQGNNGATYRAEQIQKLITDFADYPHVIIGGDWNVGNSNEYDAFVNAGYEMANHGWLGNINTYPAGDNPTSCLDNILCKGFKINGIKIVNDATLSDHCCIYADFTLIR